MSKRSARGSRQAEVLPAQQPEELDAAELQLSSDEEYDSDDSDLASLSGSDGEGGSGVDREIENAVLGYMAAAEKQRQGGGGGSDR